MTARLVGRADQRASVAAALVEGSLVTLTGPGGIGKTALALDVASAWGATHGGEVRVADLTRIDEAAAVESLVAEAFGLASFDAIGPGATDDGSLLVVDNCEHVVDAAASAIEAVRVLLPRVVVCATSRVPLGLRDETVVVLDPLDVPALGIVDADAAAVELFVEVARRTGGAVTDADLPAVCDLCRRLDGVPLAIEIAATRTRSLSPGEIVERLGDRLDALTHGGFRRAERQRSVRHTIEWSYEILDDGAQALFVRLGALAGPFPVTAAAAAVAAPPADTVDHLDTLVAASLLSTRRGPGGTTWYRQLHAVRSYARDRLRDAGELDETTERVVDHMVEVAAELSAQVRDGWTAATIASIVAAQENLLSALRWCVDHDDAPDRAVALTTVLWGHQLRSDEVCALGEEVLRRWPDPDTTANWADAAATVATCRFVLGRLDEAEALVDRALPVADRSRFAPVTLRRVLGQLRWMRGARSEALACFEEAASEADRRGHVALVHDARLVAAHALADLGRAHDALEATRATRREVGGDGPSITAVHAASIEADVLLRLDPAAAVELARRAIDDASAVSYTTAVVADHRTLALGLLLTGDVPAAAAAALDGVQLLGRHGTMSQTRAMLEAAAVVVHHGGLDGWADLAAAARVAPHVAMLSDVSAYLPETPGGERRLDLGSALALAREQLAALAEPVPAPDRAGADEQPVESLLGAPSAVGACRFLRRGDHWEVCYAGRAVMIRHSKGMVDLARLLARPGVELAAADLAGSAVTSPDTGEVIDATARRRYEERIRELQAEIEAAEDTSDLGRAEVATAEFDTLVEHLGAALALGGRARRGGGSAERARTAVTRRIRTAIAHIAGQHPELGRHLGTSVRTGSYCSYRPEHDLLWTT